MIAAKISLSRVIKYSKIITVLLQIETNIVSWTFLYELKSLYCMNLVNQYILDLVLKRNDIKSSLERKSDAIMCMNHENVP